MPKRTAVRSKIKKRERRADLRIVPIVGVIFLLLVMVAGYVLLQQKQPQVLSAAVEPNNVDAANLWDQMAQNAAKQVRYFKGAPDAPVTLLEFSDFQ